MGETVIYGWQWEISDRRVDSTQCINTQGQYLSHTSAALIHKVNISVTHRLHVNAEVIISTQCIETAHCLPILSLALCRPHHAWENYLIKTSNVI